MVPRYVLTPEMGQAHAIHQALLTTCLLGQSTVDSREGNGTHSSTLDWKIPWMEEPGSRSSWSQEPGGACSLAGHGVAKSWTRLSDFTFTFYFHALAKEMATHSSVLAWRIPGMGEPGGPPSMGLHRVGHD